MGLLRLDTEVEVLIVTLGGLGLTSNVDVGLRVLELLFDIDLFSDLVDELMLG